MGRKSREPKKTADAALSLFRAGNGLVSLLSGLLAAVLIIYSGYALYDSFATEYRALNANRDLMKYKPDTESAGGTPNKGMGALSSVNEDYRAWLTINGTTIDYPIVQGLDDVYYASHDVYRNVSLSGAIYLAAANNRGFTDSYNLIYGHHMDNGAMFGSLDKFKDSAYFRNHQKGVLVTESGTYDLTLFAVATTDAYEKQIYTVGNRSPKVISFLTGSRDRDAGVGTKVLIYDEQAAADAGKIVVLSTCADASTNGRLVVFARMDRREDLPIITPETITEAPATTAPATTAPATTAPATATPTATTRTGEASTATATPAPEETAILRVRYQLEGEDISPERVLVYAAGGHYYVVSPQMPGYEVSIEILEGTIEEDTTIIVHYYPTAHEMVIRYVFTDGTNAAEPYRTTLLTGAAYDVASPEISGYMALRLRVSGTNPGHDETLTVVYVPADSDIVKLHGMEDYETPLNLENVYCQIGTCIE